jgi:hypothetical protein
LGGRMWALKRTRHRESKNACSECTASRMRWDGTVERGAVRTADAAAHAGAVGMRLGAIGSRCRHGSDPRPECHASAAVSTGYCHG